MSAINFVLKSMIPYTRENILLATRPQRFFAELEELGTTKAAYTQARSRALKTGLIERQVEAYSLTEEGYRRLMRQSLTERAAQAETKEDFLVCFDIPETQRKSRLFLREALSTLKFRAVQRSVWIGNAEFEEDVLTAAKLAHVADNIETFRLKT